MTLRPAPLIEVDYTPENVLRSPGPWKALLWDMDGTLLDSQVAILNRFVETFVHFGVEAPPINQLRYLIGPPIGNTLDTYLDVPVEESRAYYRSLSQRDGLRDQHLFPWIPELLKTLHQAGYTMAVASSKTQAEVERICTTFGIDEFLDVIVGSSEDRPDKTLVVAEALRQLGTHDALMIGDRWFDTEGAMANGIPTVLVEWGYADKKEFSGAMASVATAEELIDFLDNPTK